MAFWDRFFKVSGAQASSLETNFTLDSWSNELETTAQSIAAASNEQSAAIHESVASMTQIHGMLTHTHGEVQSGLKLTTQATARGASAKESISRLEDAMIRIGSSKDQLEELRSVFQKMEQKTQAINDIVMKTQICSFNASVEAARAGQFGKGFGVVADEVGRLAKTTGKAAKEIDTLIGKSQTALENAVRAVLESVEGANKVTQAVATNYDSLHQIIHQIHVSLDGVGKASNEQLQGITQMTKALEQIEKTTSENRHLGEKLNELSKRLKPAMHTLGTPSSATPETQVFSGDRTPSDKEILSLVNSIAQKSTPLSGNNGNHEDFSPDDPSFQMKK